MSRIKKYFNNYILKKRYIYSLSETEEVNVRLKKTQCVILKGASLLEHKELFKESANTNKVFERSKNHDIFCLTCFDENKALVGYFWGIVPKEKVWHDSIPIEVGQAFLFNGYVNPEFRGKSIFPFLIDKMSRYIKNEYQVDEIIDVVEVQNVASVRAHNKVNAKIYSNNFLIKFIGRNIFSIYRRKIILLLRNKRNRI
ncbi:GNAT family N-acetyltransferase [Sporosarcina ureilytica]|uniref:N-acetyltransferase domain-containing protein n=1 Tax=Sporosarcina ureilytica TaxID=298596 RepID=A0A1D8JJA0_9BACL|nr:GNAT family N-acetyltransferase [Sporosarcina ureilytica]AOV08786.1 hypothetical protein BI350_15360 [Sporosarcina ureilytica]